MTDQPEPLSRSLTEHHDGLGLNDLVTIFTDEPDPEAGNASHVYVFAMKGVGVVGTLHFQHGPREQPGSIPGLLDSAVIVALIDRFRGFQSSQYACEENAQVLAMLEGCLASQRERADRRKAAGTLGTRKADR